jgi:polar amino acid transport system permease protein
VLAGFLIAIPVAAARLSKNRSSARSRSATSISFAARRSWRSCSWSITGAGEFRPQLEASASGTSFRDAFNCAVFTFTLNTAAYQAEIYRGAIRSIPKGQWEAARPWSGPHPDSAPGRFPAGGHDRSAPARQRDHPDDQGSAVASIVTVYEVMGQTARVYSRTFDMTIYFYAAALYLVLVETIRRLWNRLKPPDPALAPRYDERRAVRTADLVPATR